MVHAGIDPPSANMGSVRIEHRVGEPAFDRNGSGTVV